MATPHLSGVTLLLKSAFRARGLELAYGSLEQGLTVTANRNELQVGAGMWECMWLGISFRIMFMVTDWWMWP